MFSQSCFSAPSCGTMNSGSSGMTLSCPGWWRWTCRLLSQACPAPALGLGARLTANGCYPNFSAAKRHITRLIPTRRSADSPRQHRTFASECVRYARLLYALSEAEVEDHDG